MYLESMSGVVWRSVNTGILIACPTALSILFHTLITLGVQNTLIVHIFFLRSFKWIIWYNDGSQAKL